MDSVQTFMQYAWSGINFLLIITLLVFVHELGHYLAAKATGMHVDAFAVMVGGIRKTNLEAGLRKSLVSSKIVGALYGLALLGSALAAIQNLPTIYAAGLGLVAFVFPVWIASRIGQLYRMHFTRWLKPLVVSYAVAWGILWVATRGIGFSRPADFLLISFYASVIGLLSLYYSPLSNRLEEGKMGHGSISDGGEPIEVRFRPLASFTSKAGTEFSLLVLPLGGFARMRGMEPHADGSEVHVEGGFYSKPPIARLLVLFAGPLFSILLGCLLFFISFAAYGEWKAVDKPTLARLSSDGAAAKAGLKEGDKVLKIAGKAPQTFYDIVLAIRESQGKPIAISYQRGAKTGTVTVTPVLEAAPSPVLGPGMELTGEAKRQYKLGASPPIESLPVPVATAATRAAMAPILYATELGGLLRSPERAAESLSGPAAIAKETHSASQAGSQSLLILAAVLSTSLGFMNLLPIPPLDGGQMVVAVIEMFRRGRRLSMETQATLTTVGMGLVMMLMILVFSQDAGRLLGGK
ncbi:MAG: site-2 protease family protein [Fimbriimonadaceae bacterium]|nr:site-2 protease family protein [Fimbriimonadaceae bacterium]